MMLILKNFLTGIETLFLDCDGVLWQGRTLFPNLK